MIDQKRNERFWHECEWTRSNPSAPKYLRLWRQPGGELRPLPSPSDPVSFTGYLLRDALPKVREKHGDDIEVSFWKSDKGETCHVTYCVDRSKLPWTWHDQAFEADTLFEAMFLAFETALGLDKEEK